MKKTEIRKMAEEIGKKAASNDYIEDGGYIRDWLVNDIEKALIKVRLEALKESQEIIEMAKIECESLRRILT